MNLLSTIVIDPEEEEATASIIWLHGLGANGYDFAPLVPQLKPQQHPVRFVFPHAPEQPITLIEGMVMPAWYDITMMDLSLGEDEAGIRLSQQRLGHLIEREIESGIAPERIFLAGFSQGGAVALQTGLRYPTQLGGIIALSTYLPLADTFILENSHSTNNLPIFMAHGNYDQVIPMNGGERSASKIKESGYDVEWFDYPMEHSVSDAEVNDIAAWISRQLT